jgi:hypothetical protein
MTGEAVGDGYLGTLHSLVNLVLILKLLQKKNTIS